MGGLHLFRSCFIVLFNKSLLPQEDDNIPCMFSSGSFILLPFYILGGDLFQISFSIRCEVRGQDFPHHMDIQLTQKHLLTRPTFPY